jgi:prepilin peptidase CpaA
MIEFPVLMIFPVAMAFAGAMDFFTMTIPNRVSLLLIAGFAVAALVAGMPLMSVVNHVLAGLLLLVAGIFMFSMRWLGGGDAKLLAAAALWIGFDSLFPYLLQVTMLGGVLATLLMGFRGFTLPVWFNTQDWAMRLHKQDGGIPYGIAIAGAALWTYPTTYWFLALAA